MNTFRIDPRARRRRRIFAILGGAILLSASAALISLALRDSIVFFFGPTELSARTVSPEDKLRLGGMVAENSVKESANGTLEFLVTDFETSLPVSYQGALPDLFREGQGVVAEGYFVSGVFRAERILAKHDENYMPREVADALKEAGVWRVPKNP